MRSWLVAFGVGVAASACLVEPEHVLACGDGYVDAVVGEECDPNDRSSYIGACRDTSRPFGSGACDPETCEIINTDVQCAHCGDGIIDFAAGEECDGSNIGMPCPGGGQPTCRPPSTDPLAPGCTVDLSSCETCGNGELDPGEECDAAQAAGGLVAPYPCAGNDVQTPLPSLPGKPYTSGTAVQCSEDCKYLRSSCGYCGDGERDDALPVSPFDDTLSFPELCDGDDFEASAIADPICAQFGAQANVACDDDCFGVTAREPRCCLAEGAECSPTGDLRCCSEYAHPEIDDACLPVLLPLPPDDGSNGAAFLCR